MRRFPHGFLRRLLLLTVPFAVRALCAAEPAVTEAVVSPDGIRRVEARYFLRGPGTEIRILLFSKGGLQRLRVLSPDLDARYVKISWAPTSRAVLVGEGYKPMMNLTLYRLVRRHWLATHFDLGERMSSKEERDLPLRTELQSHAPVDRVTWSTVKWPSPTRCTMLYILHGLGYEGEGDVTVDFTDHAPVLTTSRLRALTHPEYFNLD